MRFRMPSFVALPPGSGLRQSATVTQQSAQRKSAGSPPAIAAAMSTQASAQHRSQTAAAVTVEAIDPAKPWSRDEAGEHVANFVYKLVGHHEAGWRTDRQRRKEADRERREAQARAHDVSTTGSVGDAAAVDDSTSASADTPEISADAQSEQANVLIIGLSAPQGWGKTTLCNKLASHFDADSFVTLSLDDFYLPHADLRALSDSTPSPNPLYRVRGNPGTHDVRALRKVLEDIKIGKKHLTHDVYVPIYDKSLQGGAGDRDVTSEKANGGLGRLLPIGCNAVEDREWGVDAGAGKGHSAEEDADGLQRADISRIKANKTVVVLVEGWCLGFLGAGQRDANSPNNPSAFVPDPKGSDGVSAADFGEVAQKLAPAMAHLEQNSSQDEHYHHIFTELIDSWIVVELPGLAKPIQTQADRFRLEWVVKWRLEAEELMKQRNGGRGMSEAEVLRFCDAYLPTYRNCLARFYSGFGFGLVPGDSGAVELRENEDAAGVSFSSSYADTPVMRLVTNEARGTVACGWRL